MALKDEDQKVRENAAKTLGLIKDPQAVEPLIDTLQDSEIFVRQSAAVALGEMKDFRAIGPLILALKDDIYVVRYSASEALKEITGKDFGLDLEKWQKWWD